MEVYKAAQETVETLHRTRQHVGTAIRPHTNRPVRVETIDGEIYECVIVQIDHRCVYIQPIHDCHAHAEMMRGFIPYGYGHGGYYPGGAYGYPASSVILPLALFDLLAVTLI